MSASGLVHASENKPSVKGNSTASASVLLVYGDSLSAGYGISLNESWPALLQERLGPKWRVVNASQSGETTAGGLTRFAPTLEQYKPSVVVLQLGANDGLRGLPLASTKANLAEMIRQSQSSKAKVLLVGMRLPPNFGPTYTNQFRLIFDELAQQFRLPSPPFMLNGIADNPELFQADQLHPIASAQPKVLENIWQPLKAILAR